MKRFLILFLVVFAYAVWPLEQIKTDHYYVYFDKGSEYTAFRVAEIAEEVFNRLASLFNGYADFTRIHITIDNNVDYGNGWANYYNNQVNINTTNLDTQLRGSHDWLKNVVTHELTHIFSLKAAARNWWIFNSFNLNISLPTRKIPFYLSLLFYHLNLPVWFVEGIAQFETDQFNFDSWDTQRDMLLRMAVLENQLLSYDAMGVISNKDKFYGEMVYNQGYSLLKYISKRFGHQKVESLTVRPSLLDFDKTIKRELNISANRLYREWVQDLKKNYQSVQAEVKKKPFNEKKLVGNGFYNFYPKFSPKGDRLAYISSDDLDFAATYLTIYDLTSKKLKSFKKDFVFSSIDWIPGQEKILFASPRENHSSFLDLYVFDLKTEKRIPISANLRAIDFDVSHDGKRIVFVQNNDGTHNLGVMNIDGTEIKYLTHHINGIQYYSPQWSPDGKKILFSIYQQGNDRDIGIIDAKALPYDKKRAIEDSLYSFQDSIGFDPSAQFKLLLATPAEERDAAWLADGSGILFCSDKDGIFNIYEYKFGNDSIKKLTNLIGGAFVPTLSADGKDIVYAGYHAMDFDLYYLNYLADSPYGEYALINEKRNYQKQSKSLKIEDFFIVDGYQPKLKLADISPFFSFESPYFTDFSEVGLSYIGGGLTWMLDDLLGGNNIYGGIGVYKNLKYSLDMNYDVYAGYTKRWRTVLTENRNYSPSISGSISQSVRNHVLNNTLVPIFLDTVLVPFDVDSFVAIIDYVEDARSVIRRKYSEARFNSDIPLNRYHQLGFNAAYQRFNDFSYLQFNSKMTRYFYLRDPNHIIENQPVLVDTFEVVDGRLGLWDKNYYENARLGISYQYAKLLQKKNILSYLPTQGEYFALTYLHNQSTISDVSEIDFFGFPPRNFNSHDRFNYPFTYYDDKFSTNQFFLQYGEFHQIPLIEKTVFHLRSLAILQDREIPLMWSYHPLYFWLGQFLWSYPYTFLESEKKNKEILLFGGQIWLFETGLHFPLLASVSRQLYNVHFDKIYLATTFRAADIWNKPLSRLKKSELTDLEILSEYFENQVLKEFSLMLIVQNYLNYVIPYDFYAWLVWPLNKLLDNGERIPPRFGFGISYGF